jgi:cephalosporin hydroxylase
LINDCCLVVVPRESDVAGARDGIEDLSFDAATGIAQLAGIEIASDEFNNMYRYVLDAYSEASQYLYYFVHMGVLTLKNQMDLGLIQLVVPGMGENLDVDKIVDTILAAARPIAAAFLHLMSVGEQMILSDSEIFDLPSGLNNLAVEFHVGQVNYGGSK